MGVADHPALAEGDAAREQFVRALGIDLREDEGPAPARGGMAGGIGAVAAQDSLLVGSAGGLVVDDEGTDALIDYFGRVVFELGLADAIKMGALTRYLYRPRLVELNDAETNLYVDLTAQIATRIASGEELGKADPNSPLGFLLRQRAGILGHAEGKLAALRDDLSTRANSWFQLVYCAEGRRPTEAGEPPGPNQLNEVMNLVGNQLHLAAHPYVSETPRKERKLLMRRFGTGDEVTVQAGEEGVRFLLISGAPISEPVAWHGPIVMNTREELMQAMQDLRNGTFIKPAH